MSNGKGQGKGKNKNQAQAGNVGPDGQFHYFSLDVTKNADGSITFQIGELNPLPSGYILKDFDIIKKDTSGTYKGTPWGLGPSQSVDVRTFDQWNGGNFTETYQNQPGTPSITYNMTGSAGYPEIYSSGDPVGSATVQVDF